MNIHGYYYLAEISASEHAINQQIKMPNAIFICEDQISLDVVQGYVREFIFKQFNQSKLHTTHFKIHQKSPNQYHWCEFGKCYDEQNTMPYFSFEIKEIQEDEYKQRLKSKNHLIRLIDINFIAMMVAHKKTNETQITAFIHPNFHYIKDGVFITRIDNVFAHDSLSSSTNTNAIDSEKTEKEDHALYEWLYSSTSNEPIPNNESLPTFGLKEFERAKRSMLDYPLQIGEQLVRNTEDICAKLAETA